MLPTLKVVKANLGLYYINETLTHSNFRKSKNREKMVIHTTSNKLKDQFNRVAGLWT